MNTQKTFQWAYILAGFLSLFVASLLDNMRGPLLPVISDNLKIPLSSASWFFTLGNLTAIFFTLFLVKLLQVFSERRLTITFSLFSIIGIIFALWVQNYFNFLIFAAILGTAMAFFGAFCNILTIHGTPEIHRTRTLAALHTSYGIASMLCPLLVVFLIEKQWPWPQIFMLTIPIIIVLVITLKFNTVELGPTPQIPFKFSSLNSNHYFVLIYVALYINSEVLGSMWMTTYLQNGLKLEFQIASYGIAGFFLFLAMSRGMTFFFFKPKFEKIFLWSALLLPTTFFWLSYLTKNPYLLPLTGLLGPFFPIFLAKISRKFANQWQTMTIGIVITQLLTGAILHYITGLISDSQGIRVAFQLPGLLMLLTIALLPFMLKRVKIE